MKTQRFAVLLTLINLLLLTSTFVRTNSLATTPAPSAPIIRCSSLELVDEHGKVRAELKIPPADPKVTLPDGTTGYPETVLLRLISSKGGPNVKLAATEDGSGISLGGDAGYIQLLSRASTPFVKIVTKDGHEQTLKP
jgi:hypothetical protein